MCSLSTANTYSRTSESPESALVLGCISIQGPSTHISASIAISRICHSICVVNKVHVAPAALILSRILSQSVQPQDKFICQFGGFKEIITVRFGQDWSEIVIHMAGCDADKVVKGVTACEKVERHKNPRKILALNWETPNGHLLVGNISCPYINKGKDELVLHDHIVTGCCWYRNSHNRTKC